MTYPEFWRMYHAPHAKPRTRALHYLGAFLGVASLGVVGRRGLVLAPGCPGRRLALAWLGQLVFEHNRPRASDTPYWPFVSDLRMRALFLSQRPDRELRREE